MKFTTQGCANTLQISRTLFFSLQFLFSTVLVALGLFYYVYNDLYPDDLINALFEVFDVGDEASIPTYFSVLNLVLAGALAAIIHFSERNRGEPATLGWLALSVTLILMSVDEGARIHERAGTRFLEFTALDLPIIAEHKWLLAGAVVVLVVGPLFVPFLLRIERKTSALLLLSGAVFLLGAVGLEFAGAWMMHEHGYAKTDLVYRLLRIGEEALEIYGIVLLNCTLFSYLSLRGVALTLATVDGAEKTGSPAARGAS